MEAVKHQLHSFATESLAWSCSFRSFDSCFWFSCASGLKLVWELKPPGFFGPRVMELRAYRQTSFSPRSSGFYGFTAGLKAFASSCVEA